MELCRYSYTATAVPLFSFSRSLTVYSVFVSQISLTMSEPGHHGLVHKHVDQMIIMTTLQLVQLQTKHLEDKSIPRELFTSVYTKCIALLTEVRAAYLYLLHVDVPKAWNVITIKFKALCVGEHIYM